MSLTEQGFDRPRLNELKSLYDADFIAALGPVNTDADAVVGQIIGILAAAMDDAYEALHNTYDSMYPFSAEGTSLDGAVAFVGIERLGSTPTVVVAICYGLEGTLIPAGSLTRAIDNQQYIATADTVISRSSSGDVQISIVTVTNLAIYQIITNGVSVSYNADAATTAIEIIAGLAAQFNPALYLATAEVGYLRLRSADLYTDFTLTVDVKMSISNLGTPVVFTASEKGALGLPANALTNIDSPTVGWSSVNNLVPGTIGRFTETDPQLRTRHLDSVRVTGAATVQAIRSRLLAEVASVSYVAVYENRTNVIDAFGSPPHSFEAVVEGGTNQAVADKLFQVKPAGIETFGNTSIQVLDINGEVQICKYSRSTNKFAWVRVSVNSLYEEETLTAEIVQAVKTAVMNFGSSLNIGQDIITQRFYGPIFTATLGISSITIEAALTATELGAPSYTTTNTPVGRTERATFSETRIIVVGV